MIASLIIEGINRRFKVGSYSARLITVIVSLTLGGMYYYASGAVWWQSALGVLAAASTMYAFLFKSIKSE